MNLRSTIYASTMILLGLCLNVHAGKVLILGDSLSANEPIGLASQVFEHLKNDHHVVAIGSCGSSPRWYQSDTRAVTTPCGYLRKESGKNAEISMRHLTPKLDTLVPRDLDVAVIQQGTNLYGYLVGAEKKSNAQAAQLIKSDVMKFMTELVNRAPKSRCLWVAPPQIAKYANYAVSEEAKQIMFNSIQAALKQFEENSGYTCTAHDSRLDTSPPGGDGTHFSKSSQTKQWIKSVNEKVDGLLNSPLRVDNSKGLSDEPDNSAQRKVDPTPSAHIRR